MGIVERRLRDKERRVKEIVTSARQLFLSKGYLSTTMLDIAEQAELSRRTIYLYFKSKEEISFILILESFSTILKELTAAAKADVNGAAQLVAMKRRYIDFYKNDFEQFYFTLFFDYKLTIESFSDAEAKECIQIVKDICSLFVTVLKKGNSDGSLKVNGELRTVAFTLMTIIHSTMQKVASRRELIDELLDYKELDLIENMFQILYSSLIILPSPISHP